MTIQVGGNAVSGLSAGSASVVEDLPVGVEGFAGPVTRHLREEAVFDGIPFGGAGRVVGDGDRQSRGVGQLRLDLGFPGSDNRCCPRHLSRILCLRDSFFGLES